MSSSVSLMATPPPPQPVPDPRHPHLEPRAPQSAEIYSRQWMALRWARTFLAELLEFPRSKMNGVPRSDSCLSFASIRRQEVIFVVEMTKSLAETNDVLIVMEKDPNTTQKDAITTITLRSRLLFFSAKLLISEYGRYTSNSTLDE